MAGRERKNSRMILGFWLEQLGIATILTKRGNVRGRKFEEEDDGVSFGDDKV